MGDNRDCDGQLKDCFVLSCFKKIIFFCTAKQEKFEINSRQLHLLFLLFHLHGMPHNISDMINIAGDGRRAEYKWMGQQKVAQLLCFPKVSSPVAAVTGWVILIIYLTRVAEKGN